MRKNKLINDFTTGSVPKHLLSFMLPFVASNGLQVLYSLVDMIVVGQYVGSAGLSGVSQGGILTVFTTIFCMGFSNSGQILVSQLLGAGRKEELPRVIGTLFSLTAVLGAAMALLLVVFRGVMMDFLRMPPEAWALGSQYVLICGCGLIFTYGYNSIAAILRGMGDSRHPFVFITVSSVLNLGLDLLMTGYWGMGVAGAALATVISQAVCFFASLFFLLRHREDFCFDFRPTSFRFHRSYLKKMLRLGFPMALQACAVSLSMMICSSFINRLGVAASATFGVGIKVDDIANKLSQGVQMAAAPMVGQNVGAGNHKRIRSTIWWTFLMAGVVFFLFFLSYAFLGQEIFGLFTDDRGVIEMAPVFISAIVWCFPGMVAMRGTHALLQGTGSTTVLMCMAFADAGLRLILSWLLGIVLDFGFYGFVLGFGLAAYGVAIPGMIYFLSGRWKHARLLDR